MIIIIFKVIYQKAARLKGSHTIRPHSDDDCQVYFGLRNCGSGKFKKKIQLYYFKSVCLFGRYSGANRNALCHLNSISLFWLEIAESELVPSPRAGPLEKSESGKF